MAAMDASTLSPASDGGGAHPRGLAVLAALVVLGLSGAIFYRYQAPRASARLAAEVAAAPTSAEGSLRKWHEYGAPQIHHRLASWARFAPEMPWLVTHAVDPGDGGPPAIWGVDLAALPRGISRVEGMRVVVLLPAPTLLGRAPLQGEMARHVPLRAAAEPPLDAAARLTELVDFFLSDLARALAKDVPGAELEVRIAAG
jgi:hypothetical protein